MFSCEYTRRPRGFGQGAECLGNAYLSHPGWLIACSQLRCYDSGAHGDYVSSTSLQPTSCRSGFASLQRILNSPSGSGMILLPSAV